MSQWRLADQRVREKVKGQIRLDIHHGFPELVNTQEKAGTISTIVGGDGQVYKILKIHGHINGKPGYYEYIKDRNGIITHHFFNEIKHVQR